MIANAATQILIDLNVPAMRALHATQSKMPIGTDWHVLAGMHGARTQLEMIPLKLRLYSHEWLLDRGLPSYLPDELKPKPQQQGRPRIVEAVGIIVDASSPELEPAAAAVQKQMENVVLDAYADSNSPDPKKLHERMMEARKKELRGLVLPDRAT